MNTADLIKMVNFETALSFSTYYVESNLLYIKLKTETEPTIESVQLNFQQTYEQLGEKQVKVLLDARALEFLNLPKDVLEYMGDNEYNKYQLATALLINGLAQKLLANFYLKIIKPKVKTKMFNHAEESLMWLEINQIPANFPREQQSAQ